MEKLLMCRICLATDLRMDCIVNTHLQDTYERLTMTQFETKDSRPILACYLCCARLQNCYQLSMNCLQSEELLTQMLSSNMLNPKNLQEVTRTMRLGTTPVIVETFGDALLDAIDGRVKVEPSTQSSGIEVEVKMIVNEVVENRIPEEHIKVEPTIDDRFQGAEDPEDDIPLDIVKHEPGIITPSVSVPKKLRPTKQKEGSQDTTMRQQAAAVIEGKITSKSDTVNITINKTIKQKKCKPYTCFHCQKSFNRKEHLKRHIRIHTGERPFNCTMCDKSFHCQSNLNSHVVYKHTREKPFACDRCDERFMDKRHLNRHIFLHVDLKQHICGVCSKSFSNRGALNFHIRIHGERPYQCDVCKKCFTRNSDLITHRRIHTGEKPYKCDLCPNAFHAKCALLKHVRKHALAETGERPYICDFCKKSFTYKSCLVYHIRIHTGERPHKCNVCNKSFKDKSDLVKHNRVHTGEKPYKCHICNKRYTQKRSLKSHINRHT